MFKHFLLSDSEKLCVIMSESNLAFITTQTDFIFYNVMETLRNGDI